VRFTTWTLRYNKCDWVAIERMEKQWERARVNARIEAPDRLTIATTNVAELALTFSEPSGIVASKGTFKVEIDGQLLVASPIQRRDLRRISLRKLRQKNGARWKEVNSAREDARPPASKRPGLQGPIDDAFMDSFLFVR